MFFTKEDILKIQAALNKTGIKDSDFRDAVTPLESDELMVLTQKGKNVKISLADFINQLHNLSFNDFVNVSYLYDANYITLDEAIEILPKRIRKRGVVITFQNVEGYWEIYQFNDDDESNFSNPLYWQNLKIASAEGIAYSDEEDITTMTVGDKAILKFKDRIASDSMGYVILRRHIHIADQINKPNTIYEIRYDFDLNEEELTIPENCVLKFEGGSLNNGALVGNNTKFVGVLSKEDIGTNITIDERSTYKKGQAFFDSNSNIYILWNGTEWVNITEDIYNTLQEQSTKIQSNTNSIQTNANNIAAQQTQALQVKTELENKINQKYTKPSTGIPIDDLANDVHQAISNAGKADDVTIVKDASTSKLSIKDKGVSKNKLTDDLQSSIDKANSAVQFENTSFTSTIPNVSIKQLVDNSENNIVPLTYTSTTFNSEGNNVDTLLNNISTTVTNNKNEATGKFNNIEERLDDVKDTLTSDSATSPLSANQGKVLKELLDAKVIENGSIPIDGEPTQGNTNNVVSSDGIYNAFSKFTRVFDGGNAKSVYGGTRRINGGYASN